MFFITNIPMFYHSQLATFTTKLKLSFSLPSARNATQRILIPEQVHQLTALQISLLQNSSRD